MIFLLILNPLFFRVSLCECLSNTQEVRQRKFILNPFRSMTLQGYFFKRKGKKKGEEKNAKYIKLPYNALKISMLLVINN